MHKHPAITRPVAAYLRVSTDDQRHDSQKLVLDRWLASEGIDPDKVEWYEDVETGTRIDRLGMDRLRLDVGRGLRKVIVVYALDRISRDFFDGVNLLGAWLKLGARVASATEPLDLSGELGQALAGVIFALGAAEHRKRRDRQRAGIEAAKARGVKFGRPRGEGGVPGKRLKVTAEQEAACRRLKAEGVKIAAIARATGLSRPTVYSILAEIAAG